MNDQLMALLKKHEGCSLVLYLDTVGKQTIGWGHNIQDRGLTQSQVDEVLVDDEAEHEANVRAVFPEFDSFSVNRQNALIDMMFELGPGEFSTFQKMIADVHVGDWASAASEMRNSYWAVQVPGRVAEDAGLLENG